MIWLLAGGPSWALSPTPDWEVTGTDNQQLGWEVELLDVNGDGFDDLAVALWGALAVAVYHGGAGGPSTTPDWYAEWSGFSTPEWFASGDFDGDGFEDLVISSAASREIWMYPGSASGLSETPSWTRNSLLRPVGIEDVNGDGADELAGTGLGPGAGLYLGGPGGLPAEPTWLFPQYCDREVTGLDANGDGLGDLVVVCWTDELKLFPGSPEGLSNDAILIDELVNPSFLESGDFDGDGFDDLVVGQYNYEGRIWVYPGSAQGLLPFDWTITRQGGQEMGLCLGVGDLYGDGYADLVIGSPYYSNGQEDEGAAMVVEGSAEGLQTQPSWIYEGEELYLALGYTVAVGDANGDGSDDLLLGVPWAGSDNGSALLFYGEPLDLDSDGSPATQDCDDSNPTVFPGAVEVDGDSIDQDCDGRDAGLGLADLAAGQLRITEVMLEPQAVDRSVGQWFELELVTGAPVDLIGLQLQWGEAEASVDDFLVLSPGERLVVGIDPDPSRNGGVPVGLSLPDLALSSVLRLSAGESVLDELALAELPSSPGAAAQLPPDPAGSWCLATRPYGDGDLGTPGAPNDPCALEEEEEEESPSEPKSPSSEGCGCQAAPRSPGLGALLALGLVLRGRRAQRASR